MNIIRSASYISLIALFLITGCSLKPKWQVTLHVTDDNGMPVSNANVYADYLVRNAINSKKTGVTDANGLVVLTARSGPAIGYGASNNGYYTSHLSYNFDFRNKSGGRWHPWNPTLNVILKRIGSLTPMYAKWVNIKVPDLDKPIGYDLMAGDWVTPYGKGFHADMLFMGHFDYPVPKESDFTLKISFPNQKDGIQEFKQTIIDRASELHSSQVVPNIGYQPEWIQTNIWKNGQPFKTNRDLNRNYYFRVRTVLDENGSVKSALYGKIYGDFMNFRYYLNPTPNDRSVEYDLKHNLVKDLKPLDGVSEP